MSVVGKYDGMGKYIVIVMAFLGFSTIAMAQDENLQTPPQEMDESDMVCFLTDANTITCFVAPEDTLGEASPEENPGDNPRNDERTLREKETDKNRKVESLDNQNKKIKDGPSEIQLNAPEKRKENDYNQADVKMI